MWLGQIAWDVAGEGGLRGLREKIRWKFLSHRQKGRDVSSQPAAGASWGGHRRGGSWGKDRAGRGRGLTELERWATALMCSSSSKMSSSSSSVRCPGLQAREDQKAKDEPQARTRAGATQPQSTGLRPAGASARTVITNGQPFPSSHCVPDTGLTASHASFQLPSRQPVT